MVTPTTRTLQELRPIWSLVIVVVNSIFLIVALLLTYLWYARGMAFLPVTLAGWLLLAALFVRFRELTKLVVA